MASVLVNLCETKPRNSNLSAVAATSPTKLPTCNSHDNTTNNNRNNNNNNNTNTNTNTNDNNNNSNSNNNSNNQAADLAPVDVRAGAHGRAAGHLLAVL